MTDNPAKPAKTAKPDDTKAEATALASLTSREGMISSQGSSITGVNNGVISHEQSIALLGTPVFSVVGGLTTVLDTKIVEPGGLALSPGILAVLSERYRAINDKGRDAESDDLYVAGELVQAGACYAAIAAGGSGIKARAAWPFDLSTFKPGESTRDLVKAAQFLVAELDRRARLGDPALTVAL